MVKKTGDFFPSVFLVYSEHANLKDDPIMMPLNISLASSEEELDIMFDAVVNSFPGSEYTLEMIMYANEAKDLDDNSTIAIFGAKDGGGVTIHSVLIRKGETLIVKPQRERANLLHRWVNPSQKVKKGIKSGKGAVTDKFLNMLVVRYATASSMSLLSKIK